MGKRGIETLPKKKFKKVEAVWKKKRKLIAEHASRKK